MVSDTPTKNKPQPAPEPTVKKTVQKMTPVAAKPAPSKVVTPQPKGRAKPEGTAKKGIDAALDGLE